MKKFSTLLWALGAACSCTCLSFPALAQSTVLAAKFPFDAVDSLGAWRQETGKEEAPNLLARETAAPHSGTGALKFEILQAHPRQRNIYTGITIPPAAEEGPRRLRLRFFCKTKELAAGQVAVAALERDQAKVLGWAESKAAIPVAPAAEWQENSVEVQLKPATRVVTLFFSLKSPSPGQVLWVDDLTAEVVSGPAS